MSFLILLRHDGKKLDKNNPLGSAVTFSMLISGKLKKLEEKCSTLNVNFSKRTTSQIQPLYRLKSGDSQHFFGT